LPNVAAVQSRRAGSNRRKVIVDSQLALCSTWNALLFLLVAPFEKNRRVHSVLAIPSNVIISLS
jgi:hypothetical protein